MRTVTQRSEEDKRAHVQNADKPMPWVLEQLDDAMPEVHARAYVVGRWVWVGFDSRPEAWITRGLYRLGFRWNRRRRVWQHSCGVHTRRSPGDPRLKYGVLPVGTRADDDAADVA